MSKEKHSKQEPLTNLNSAEHVLNVVIEADKKDTSGQLNHGVHFVFKAIQNDPKLVQRFCDCFLNKIIKEMDEFAKSGSFSDLARRQMSVGLYQNLPQMKAVAKKFEEQLSAKQFPWIQQFIDQTERALEKGLKTADNALIIATIQDIGRYSAVTGGHALFTSLMHSAKNKIEHLFCKEGMSPKLQEQYTDLVTQLKPFGIEIKPMATSSKQAR